MIIVPGSRVGKFIEGRKQKGICQGWGVGMEVII